MSVSEQIYEEQQEIERTILHYPTLLLLGPTITTLARTKEVLGGLHKFPIVLLKNMAQNIHPDLYYLSGRQTTPDDSRDIRDRVTANPAIWPFRYLLISDAEIIHNNAAQALLKLIEEPPSRLRILLTSDRSSLLPETILSRSMHVAIRPPTKKYLEDYLRDLGVDEPIWRAQVSKTVPDLAQDLDVGLTKEWFKLWSCVVGGIKLTPDFPWLWSKHLTEQETGSATTTICWSILAEIASKHPTSPLWRAITQLAISQREKSRMARLSKLSLNTSLATVYAYAKTITTRNK